MPNPGPQPELNAVFDQALIRWVRANQSAASPDQLFANVMLNRLGGLVFDRGGAGASLDFPVLMPRLLEKTSTGLTLLQLLYLSDSIDLSVLKAFPADTNPNELYGDHAPEVAANIQVSMTTKLFPLLLQVEKGKRTKKSVPEAIDYRLTALSQALNGGGAGGLSADAARSLFALQFMLAHEKRPSDDELKAASEIVLGETANVLPEAMIALLRSRRLIFLTLELKKVRAKAAKPVNLVGYLYHESWDVDPARGYAAAITLEGMPPAEVARELANPKCYPYGGTIFGSSAQSIGVRRVSDVLPPDGIAHLLGIKSIVGGVEISDVERLVQILITPEPSVSTDAGQSAANNMCLCFKQLRYNGYNAVVGALTHAYGDGILLDDDRVVEALTKLSPSDSIEDFTDIAPICGLLDRVCLSDIRDFFELLDRPLKDGKTLLDDERVVRALTKTVQSTSSYPADEYISGLSKLFVKAKQAGRLDDFLALLLKKRDAGVRLADQEIVIDAMVAKAPQSGHLSNSLIDGLVRSGCNYTPLFLDGAPGKRVIDNEKIIVALTSVNGGRSLLSRLVSQHAAALKAALVAPKADGKTLLEHPSIHKALIELKHAAALQQAALQSAAAAPHHGAYHDNPMMALAAASHSHAASAAPAQVKQEPGVLASSAAGAEASSAAAKGKGKAPVSRIKREPSDAGDQREPKKVKQEPIASSGFAGNPSTLYGAGSADGKPDDHGAAAAAYPESQ